MNRSISRRQFVKLGSSSIAASAGALHMSGGIQSVLAAPVDTSGYKALVCVFLYGGNNSFNWFVPRTDAAYNTYARSRGNLALANNTLLPLDGTASDGNQYGIHPSCPELQALFNAPNGHAAIIGNIGTLVRPTTAAEARSGTVPLPPQLFSHIDQQTLWMTSTADSPEHYGWAGRVADLYAQQGINSQLSLNINVGGSNYWQEGQTSIPYVLGTNGAPILNAANSGFRGGARSQAVQALLTQASNDNNLFIKEYATIQSNAAAKVTVVNTAFNAAGDLTTPFPTYPGDNSLGAQLHQVARCIKARTQIGDARQIFFVAMGGFDTHNGELATQANLLRILSQNLNSFWNAMGELGVQNNVTLFTASDFGRSLGSNGDGSDHAWGGHSLVLGGAVNPGFYGSMPDLNIGGPNDMGNGRIVPTTSTDQHAATLSRWFGVADSDLDSVFPNLRNFATRNLGFV
jgi:uncharacterized protein (DUF1501 family)